MGLTNLFWLPFYGMNRGQPCNQNRKARRIP